MPSVQTLSRERELSAVEKSLLGVSVRQIHRLLPGLVLTVVLAWVATRSSQFIGVELMGFRKTPVSAAMLAILLGLVIGNAVPLPRWLQSGLTFVVKKALRLGIILLGVRLSITDVIWLGGLSIPIVTVCILSALVLTTLLNRSLGLPKRLGTLIAVGTSICGVSAIVAAGPAIDARDEEVAYAIAVITIFGLLATLVYPYLAHTIFAGDALRAGLFLGTAVHDTSQVMGSALVYCDVFALPECLDVASITKMVRNVSMALVIPLMALYYRRQLGDSRDGVPSRASVGKLLPLFVLGFLVFAAMRSIGDVSLGSSGRAYGLWEASTWNVIHGGVKDWASRLMVLALVGVGLNTRLCILRGLGVRPFLVGLGAALSVGLVSFVAISAMGAWGLL